MGTYLEEALPPRLFDGYHMDMYEPNFEIKNEIAAPKIDAPPPPVIESTSAASSYTGNYSAEEAEHLIRCIQAVILSSEPSQGDGLRLPTTVVKENIEEVPSFQLIVQQHSVMIDHLASGAAGNNLVLREKLDAVEARPLTNTVTKTDLIDTKMEYVEPIKKKKKSKKITSMFHKGNAVYNKQTKISPRKQKKKKKKADKDPNSKKKAKREPPMVTPPRAPTPPTQPSITYQLQQMPTTPSPIYNRQPPISLQPSQEDSYDSWSSPTMPYHVYNMQMPVSVTHSTPNPPPRSPSRSQTGYASAHKGWPIHRAQRMIRVDTPPQQPPSRSPHPPTQPYHITNPQAPVPLHSSAPAQPYPVFAPQGYAPTTPSPVYNMQTPVPVQYPTPPPPQQRQPPSYSYGSPSQPWEIYASQQQPSYWSSPMEPYHIENEQREVELPQDLNDEDDLEIVLDETPSGMQSGYAPTKANFFYSLPEAEGGDNATHGVKPSSLYYSIDAQGNEVGKNNNNNPNTGGTEIKSEGERGGGGGQTQLSTEEALKVAEREKLLADLTRTEHPVQKFVVYSDSRILKPIFTARNGIAWQGNDEGCRMVMSVFVMDTTALAKVVSVVDIVSVFYEKLRGQHTSLTCSQFSEHAVLSKQKLIANKLDWQLSGTESWQGRQLFIPEGNRLYILSAISPAREFEAFWKQVSISMEEFAIESAGATSASKNRDWNAEFQAIRKIAQEERAKPLSEFTSEFVRTATRIGKTIILEAHLSDWLKTIPPKDVGGVAGGSKYMAEGIFFKFAKDEMGLYGGDEFAGKACDHELKGLNALLNCWIEDLNFPCICIVDFLGFRLIASTILPIGSDTIIYGSNNGGIVVKDEDPKMRKQVELAAGLLNLKAHYVGRPSNQKLLYLAGDVEGHKGRDGQLYLLDTARVFPADKPKKGVRGCFLYRLLRPELVKSNSVPLSSDVFSRWGTHDKEIHNKEALEAAKRLQKEVIPKFAEKLYEQLDGKNNNSENLSMSGWDGEGGASQLIQWLHKDGINVRYLGKVYRLLSKIHLKRMTTPLAETTAMETDEPVVIPVTTSVSLRLVLTEMVARVAKVKLRQLLREEMKKSTNGTASASGAAYRNVITNYFNTTFFRGHLSEEEHQFFWEVEMLGKLFSKFEVSTLPLVLQQPQQHSSDDDEDDDNNHNKHNMKLWDVVDLRTLYLRLQLTMGLKFDKRQAMLNFDLIEEQKKSRELSQAQQHPQQQQPQQLPYVPSGVKVLTLRDLKRFEPTVKSMRYVAMYEGFALLKRADELYEIAEAKTKEATLKKTEKAYWKAATKFQECYASMPLEPNGLMNWGYALMRLGQIESKRLLLPEPDRTAIIRKASRLFVESAERYFESLRLATKTHHTAGQGQYNMGLAVYHHCKLLWLNRDNKALHAEFAKLVVRARDIYASLHAMQESEGERVVKGNVPYMLACIAGMMGDEGECMKWLLESKKVCLSATELAVEEFVSMRDLPWFQGLIEQVPQCSSKNSCH